MKLQSRIDCSKIDQFCWIKRCLFKFQKSNVYYFNELKKIEKNYNFKIFNKFKFNFNPISMLIILPY